MGTFGQVSVPQAIAATAWAPPAFSTCVTPALLAQYSTSGVTCGHTYFLHMVQFSGLPACQFMTAALHVLHG